MISPIAVLHTPAPFGWPGGKRYLVKTILPLIPPHKTYVEPFAGAAWVFWAKEPSEVEVLNDVHPDLMRFYRGLQEIEACDVVRLAIQAKGKPVGTLTPCEFLARVACSYNSKGRGLSNLDECATGRPLFHRRLPEYKRRIKGVRLHNEDWERVVRRYDAPDTFFYLDPPYAAPTGDNPGVYVFEDNQEPRLAAVLPTLKGKWLLSYADLPRVREAFAGYNILSVHPARADWARGGSRQRPELLVANYPLPVAVAESDAKTIEELAYGREVVEKRLLQIEEHLRSYPCPFCLRKHLLDAEAHLEEIIPMSEGEEQTTLLDLLEQVRAIRKRIEAENLACPPCPEHSLSSRPGEMEETGEYVRETPKLIEVWKTTIEKHYLEAEDVHPGSIRIVKPKPDVLVYLACRQEHSWDPAAVTCSPNPSVYKTIVPNTPGYRREVEEWAAIGVPVEYKEERVGVEPTEKWPPRFSEVMQPASAREIREIARRYGMWYSAEDYARKEIPKLGLSRAQVIELFDIAVACSRLDRPESILIDVRHLAEAARYVRQGGLSAALKAAQDAGAQEVVKRIQAIQRQLEEDALDDSELAEVIEALEEAEADAAPLARAKKRRNFRLLDFIPDPPSLPVLLRDSAAGCFYFVGGFEEAKAGPVYYLYPVGPSERCEARAYGPGYRGLKGLLERFSAVDPRDLEYPLNEVSDLVTFLYDNPNTPQAKHLRSLRTRLLWDSWRPRVST